MSSRVIGTALVIVLGLRLGGVPASIAAAAQDDVNTPAGLWELAKSKQKRPSLLDPVHRPARARPPVDEGGLAAAIDWCRKTAVTKVYIETFRNGYTAERETLQQAKERSGRGFRGLRLRDHHERRQALHRLEPHLLLHRPGHPGAAPGRSSSTRPALFDEIMIDDFWFTDCTCPECDAARQAKTVTIGDQTLSGGRRHLGRLPLRADGPAVAGPRARRRPSGSTPRSSSSSSTRSGTTSSTSGATRCCARRPTSTGSGSAPRRATTTTSAGADTPQYEAYFIMRWLGGIGGAKCGGGWYDPYGTTEQTYLEQARQTVLGGARESLLFCYGSLLKDTGPKNVERLRANIPELLAVAEQVGRRQTVGVAAYKPANSHPEKEPRVFDFVGMLGLPLVPCHEFPADAPAAFFSVHALKDAELPATPGEVHRLGQAGPADGRPEEKLAGQGGSDGRQCPRPGREGRAEALLDLPQQELDGLRAPLLRPLGHTFAPRTAWPSTRSPMEAG